jgi:hypothetical protein
VAIIEALAVDAVKTAAAEVVPSGFIAKSAQLVSRPVPHLHLPVQGGLIAAILWKPAPTVCLPDQFPWCRGSYSQERRRPRHCSQPPLRIRCRQCARFRKGPGKMVSGDSVGRGVAQKYAGWWTAPRKERNASSGMPVSRGRSSADGMPLPYLAMLVAVWGIILVCGRPISVSRWRMPGEICVTAILLAFSLHPQASARLQSRSQWHVYLTASILPRT